MGDVPQKPIEMPDTLAEAERFKRLFIDPAVTAMSDKMEAHLAPVVAGQRKLFAQMTEQKTKDETQDNRLQELEKKQSKALIGWGVFATGLSIVLSTSWNWIAKKAGLTE